MRPGFTILSDMTELDVMADNINELIEQTQQQALAHGLHMIAAVYAPNSSAMLADEANSEENGLPMRTFIDLWEADRFLDELAAEATV